MTLLPQLALAYSILVPCMLPSALPSPGVLRMKVSLVFSHLDAPSRPPSPPKKVNFDSQLPLSQSTLAHANPYFPVPVPSPPWIHPSPSSDTTLPTSSSESPSSALASYTTPAGSPPHVTEQPLNDVLVDTQTQDMLNAEPLPQSPLTSRGVQGPGRRPGACSRCKKLKVCAPSISM